jgi:hypothetical protein
MNTILTLPPAALHQAALEIAKLEATERHWSRIAVILGRVEDEKLYPGLGFANGMAYGTLALHLSVDEYLVLRGLWRMVKTAARVAFETWEAVPKTHALQIKRAVALGGDAGEWIEKAKGMTAEELRRVIDEQVGKESFVTFKCAMPASLADMTEEALIKALPEATGEATTAPEMTAARGLRFRCWEVVVRNYLLGNRGRDA